MDAQELGASQLQTGAGAVLPEACCPHLGEWNSEQFAGPGSPAFSGTAAESVQPHWRRQLMAQAGPGLSRGGC